MDGQIARVEFYQGATLIGTATSAPYTATWQNVPEGQYSLSAKAIDNGGGETYSSAVSITVGPAGLKVYYLHSDHLNTPRIVTDEQNRIVWRNTPLAEPFGTAAPEQDPDGDGMPFTLNLRFPGQYYDKETNTSYNYFRDYSPETGRYVQSDPIGLEGGINTYSYVENDPLNYFDPDGLIITSTIGGLQKGMTMSQATAIGSMGNATMAAGGVAGVTTVAAGAAGGVYIIVPKAARIAVGVAKATIKGALSKTPGLPPPKPPVYPQCTPPAISTPALPSSVPPLIPLTLQFPK